MPPSNPSPSIRIRDPLMRDLVKFCRLHPKLFVLTGKPVLYALRLLNPTLHNRLLCSYGLDISTRRFSQVWAVLCKEESRNPHKIAEFRLDMELARTKAELKLVKDQLDQTYTQTQKIIQQQQHAMAISRINEEERKYWRTQRLDTQEKSFHFPMPKACGAHQQRQEEPRRVVGKNTLYVMSHCSIVKLEIKERVTISQLRETHRGMVAAFLVNPNIATSSRDYISPPGKAPLLVVKYRDTYRIGVLKSSNLLMMDLLLWKLSHSELLRRQHWHHPGSWDEATLPSALKVLDGGYVNQVYSTDCFIGVDLEPPACQAFIYLSGGPDYCQIPVRRKSLMIYCKIPEDTIGRQERLRTVPIGEKHLVSVPLDKREDMDSTDRDFVAISLPQLKKICKTDFLNEKEFHAAVRSATKAEPTPMLVPSLQLPTKIIAVLPSDYEVLMHQEIHNVWCGNSACGQHQYIIREECGLPPPPDEKDSIGVCIASVEVEAGLAQTTEDITFESAKTFHAALGWKGQTRSCAMHEGLAAYRNSSRGTKKPNPTPAVADHDISSQSYCDAKSQTNLLALFEVEKRLKELTKNAKAVGNRLLPALFSIPEEEQADRAIVTCGVHWRKRVAGFLGFVNGTHIDVNDFIANELFDKIALASDYFWQLRKMRDLVGFGSATTCQYKHLWNDGFDRESYEVVAFFLHHGVGVAHPLVDYSGFSFLGFASKHSTSFCYLVDHNTKETFLQNRQGRDIFMMFAWGSGGKSNVRRRQRFRDLGGHAPRVTQTVMDDFISTHLNPAQQAVWDSMTEHQQDAYRTGEEMGENNEDEPHFPEAVFDQANGNQGNQGHPPVASI